MEAIRKFVQTAFELQINANIGKLPPQTGVYPYLLALIIRNQSDGYRDLHKLRWGMPSSSQALYQAAKARANKLIQKHGKQIDHDELEARR